MIELLNGPDKRRENIKLDLFTPHRHTHTVKMTRTFSISDVVSIVEIVGEIYLKNIGEYLSNPACFKNNLINWKQNKS